MTWHTLQSAVLLIKLLSVAVLVSTSVASGVAYAGPITFTGQSSITIPEDGGAHDFFYTLTNNSGATLTSLGTVGTLLFTGGFGDSSELHGVSYGFQSGASTCGSSLGDGTSCTWLFEVVPDNGAGEIDSDIETFDNVLAASFTPASGGLVSLTESVSVTITDPAVVPEPASVLLFGGALGCLGLVCQRRHQLTR